MDTETNEALLRAACIDGKREKVMELIEKGANINELNKVL